VHIAQPDGRIIPFDTFNLFYRDEQAQRLQQLRDEIRAAPVAKPIEEVDA
jgi:7,8-dihydro-6-hydroxymethylpterin dimethyltransferase